VRARLQRHQTVARVERIRRAAHRLDRDRVLARPEPGRAIRLYVGRMPPSIQTSVRVPSASAARRSRCRLRPDPDR